MVSICTLLMTALAFGSLWHARALSIALGNSESYRIQAELNEDHALAREQAIKEHQYALHIKLANDAWKAGNTYHMRGFLSAFAKSRTFEPGFEWYYLSGQLDSAQMVLKGHAKQINSVAYSPDGTILASASDDGLINIWSANSEELITTLRGHKYDVNEVHFSADGKWLASCGSDGVKIWDRNTFEELHAIQGFDAPVSCLAISSDGKFIATGTRFDKKRHTDDYEAVAIWEVGTWQRRFGISGFRNHVHSIDFAPNGDSMAIASSEEILICDAHSGHLKETLSNHHLEIYCVRYSSDGSMLASSSVGSEAVIWDQASWQPMTIIRGESGGTFFSIAISPDARFVATGNNNGLVELWHATTGERVGSRLTNTDVDNKGFVMSLSFNPQGTQIACGSRPSVVRVFDVQRHPGLLAKIVISDSEIHKVAMDKALDSFVAIETGGRLSYWNLTKGQRARDLRHRTAIGGLSHGRCPLAISDSGTLVISSTNLAWDQVDVIETQTGSTVAKLQTDGHVHTVCFCDNDQYIVAVSGNDGSAFANVWETETFSLVRKQSFSPRVRTLENQDGLLGCLRDNSLDVRDAISFRKLGSVLRDSSNTARVTFSRFGKHVAFLSTDTTLTIFDWEKNEVVQRLIGPFDSLAFAPNGKAIVTGVNGKVQFWSLVSGQEMLCLNVGPPKIGKLQFAADGSRLACWSTDGDRSEIHVWTIER